MAPFDLLPQDYLPTAPACARNYGIGVVGCGGIARTAHLPAYVRFGYRVVSCYDVNADAARGLHDQFAIGEVAPTLPALLDNPNVNIIDLPVPTRFRRAIVEQICSHPRRPQAILSQKPFADSLDDARAMVEMCENAGIVLMINQQARLAPSHRALKLAIRNGDIGPLYSLLNIVRSWQDEAGSWYVRTPDFNIVDHGIHWIDLMRFFTEREPMRVKATTAMVPGQHAISPMIYTINFEFADADALMVTLHFNNIIPTRAQTARWEWIADGAHGTARLNGNLELSHAGESPAQSFALQGQWFPDAFGGSMGELMSALEEGRAPMCSGRDNLKSIALALAAVQSARSGESVRISAV